MKYFILILYCLISHQLSAQKKIVDESMRNQQERMVFKQWDRNKFTPTSGFLGLNPYYWLTWGLMPSYKNNDLRPLSPSGSQTQRLALVSAFSSTVNSYKLDSDTLRSTSLREIYNFSGAVTETDPLWNLYYSKELKPVFDNSPVVILAKLSTPVREKVISEGIYEWYKAELDILKERLNAARFTDMDRGARILTYQRMLQEYRILNSAWSSRLTTAIRTMKIVDEQQKVKANQYQFKSWTPVTDLQIAREVLKDRKF